MRSSIRALLVALSLCVAVPGFGGDATAGELMWGVDASSDSLWIVDVDTGEAELVGALGLTPDSFTTPVALATRPSDGAIFVANNSPPEEAGLATVDPETGVATLIGGPGLNGLAFDLEDTLYSQILPSPGSVDPGPMATVDPETGVPTSLGGPSLPPLSGLDFNPGDGYLYGLLGTRIVGNEFEYQLFIIDPSTGFPVSTTPVPGDFNAAAGTLVFDASGRLLATGNNRVFMGDNGLFVAKEIFDIDPVTGVPSNFGPIEHGGQGLGRIGPRSTTVGVDIRPRSDSNPVNPSSRGVIPVAILGSESFDVAEIDVTTLAFGPDAAAPLGKRKGRLKDVNGDTFTDLLSLYRTRESGIAAGDTEACITGQTLDGAAFDGCDAIRTVPACGRGYELAALVPGFAWFRRRRRPGQSRAWRGIP